MFVSSFGSILCLKYYEIYGSVLTNYDLEVNFLSYEKVSPKGRKNCFSWVTDIPLSEHTLSIVMKGGRARWRIENEVFNTLKNQGYHFEHNFGHGNQHLSNVFAHLMLLLTKFKDFAASYFSKQRLKWKVIFYFGNAFGLIFFLLSYLIG